MKKNGVWLSGLMFIVSLLVLFSQGEQQPSSGKYHPKSPGHSEASSVTILNPALFHRLNVVLERGLIQEN